MKILVLGSSGQIGGAFMERYKSEPDVELVPWDIADGPSKDLRPAWEPDLLYLAIQDCDVVLFLAFDVGGSAYLEQYQNSYDFINNNTLIMQRVFARVKAAGKPVIFASSQMSQMNWSVYGRLKAVGEAYTKALNGIVVKFWNVYGVEHDPEKFHVITDFVNAAMNDGEIRMRTDGSEERQFLYAEDCAEALMHLAVNYYLLDHDEEFHITSFEWTTIAEVAELVAEEFPYGVPVYPGDKADTVQGVRFEPDPSILKYWRPKTSLRDGIRNIVGHTIIQTAEQNHG